MNTWFMVQNLQMITSVDKQIIALSTTTTKEQLSTPPQQQQKNN